MTPVYNQKITEKMAWRGQDFKSKNDIAFDLSARNLRGLRDVLLRTRETPIDDISPRDSKHPDLDADLQGIYQEVMHGRGIVLIRGIPVDGHPVEEIERMFWVLTNHLGDHLSNTSLGARLVRVQEEPLPGGVQPARGTKSRGELAMHVDGGDTFTLMCVRQAATGGESQFSSGPAAHNEILATRPDILPILYKGFPNHRRSEQPDDQPPVTPYDVPVFANQDGRISINFTYSSILPALYEIGRKLTPEEDEALNILRAVLVDQQLEFRMEPGEATIANNFGLCHSRSEFLNGEAPDQKRLVLRAWNEVPEKDRRLPVGREFYHMENKGGRLGYDPVPGRDKNIARNDYNNVPEELANLFKAAQAKPKFSLKKTG